MCKISFRAKLPSEGGTSWKGVEDFNQPESGLDCLCHARSTAAQPSTLIILSSPRWWPWTLHPANSQHEPRDRLRVGWLNGSGRGTTRAEDAQGTPTQSHLSPNILASEDNIRPTLNRFSSRGNHQNTGFMVHTFFFFLSSLELSDTNVYEP